MEALFQVMCDCAALNPDMDEDGALPQSPSVARGIPTPGLDLGFGKPSKADLGQQQTGS